jgi:hypothetical protein
LRGTGLVAGVASRVAVFIGRMVRSTGAADLR